MATLFGHLATLLRGREDLATDALHYLLQISPARKFIRSQFKLILNVAESALPEIVRYETRLGQPGGGIPDMIGFAEDGSCYVVIENKFYARLTDHQPNTYLSAHLPQGGLLIFIVPDSRKRSIQFEISEKLNQSKEDWMPPDPNYGLSFYRVDKSNTVAVVGWGGVLKAFEAIPEHNKDKNLAQAAEDIRQLRGLCQIMDAADTFLPFREADLQDQETPRKILNIINLVKETLDEATRRKIISRKEIYPEFESAGYKVYFKREHMWFGAFYWAWQHFGFSPLWLYSSKDDKSHLRIRQSLQSWMDLSPPRAFELEGDIYIPIYIKPDTTKDGVIHYGLEQLREITERIAGGL